MWLHRHREQSGFSLPELLVVAIILGILAVIGLNTYLSQKQKANRSAAISALRNVLTFAETVKSDRGDGTYSSNPSDYAEPGAFDYIAGSVPADERNEISIATADSGETLGVATWGGENCYYVTIDRGRQINKHVAPLGDGSDCTGDFATTVPDTGWDL